MAKNATLPAVTGLVPFETVPVTLEPAVAVRSTAVSPLTLTVVAWSQFGLALCHERSAPFPPSGLISTR